MQSPLIHKFAASENLPASYEEDASSWFLPLSAVLKKRILESSKKPLLIGINGAQGTGKSTLAKLLCLLLEADGLNSVRLSIDDFYLSRSARSALAEQVHPLLANRGVPGTHNTRLLSEKIDELRDSHSNSVILLPGFSKASDDCVPEKDWLRVNGAIDVIILEGWIVGASSQSDDALSRPINELEVDMDGDASWRKFVNEKLAQEYRSIFSQLDTLILLQAPSFDQVFQWRKLQEDKLRQSATGAGLMDDAEIAQFIQHFERLTRHCLRSLPATADVVLKLDENHRIVNQTSRLA